MVRAMGARQSGRSVGWTNVKEGRLYRTERERKSEPAAVSPGRIKGAPSRSVVVVDLGVSFGGAVVSGSLLARQLAEQGDRVALVTALPPDEVIRFVGADVEVVRMRQRVSYLEMWEWVDRHEAARSGVLRLWIGYAGVVYQLLSNLPWAWRLARRCRARGADLLHANNGPDLPTTIASLLSGAALVVHLRGPYGQSRVTRPTERRASRFIAISEHVRETAVRGIPPDRVVTLHNPVEVSRPDSLRGQEVRRSLGGGEGIFLVGSVGRLVRWKGQLEFLETLEPLVQEIPSLRAVIVGDAADGGGAYEDMLHRWVSERGLEEKILFSGFRRDMTEVYAALDLLVHSAIEPEPFGRVIVEAMAQGTPVLAANTGGPLEIITDGVDGLLRDPRDPTGVGEAIRALALRPEEARRLGVAGRSTVMTRFSLPRYGRAMSRLYDEVLRGVEQKPDTGGA